MHILFLLHEQFDKGTQVSEQFDLCVYVQVYLAE